MVLTIAAGIRLADLARWLGGHARLVRAMPNTPALIGTGISGVVRGAGASTRRAARSRRAVLEAAGEVVWVGDEAMLDAVTGVSGSGPAYVFYFLEALRRPRASSGFAPGGRAAARLCDVRGRDRAGAGQRARARDAARAGDVEGRHHRARRSRRMEARAVEGRRSSRR